MRPPVRARHAMLLAADSIIDVAARSLTPLTPRRLHPGRRACDVLGRIPCARGLASPTLAVATLAARWRSALLLAYLHRIRTADLRHFLATRVQFDDDSVIERVLAGPRPLIIATPHCGANLLACLALVRRFQHRRHFAVLYRHAPHNAGLAKMFELAGAQASLLSGIGGVVRAMEVLQQGGCLVTMPDVFDEVVDTIAVPFCGRWLRVAGGLPLLAHRCAALILPALVATERGPRIRAHAGRIIDVCDCPSGDVRQDIFALICRLFAEVERLLRSSPQHWLYWDRLARVSTPLDPSGFVDAPTIVMTLARRCRANPGLLQRVPELVPLIAESGL